MATPGELRPEIGNEFQNFSTEKLQALLIEGAKRTAVHFALITAGLSEESLIMDYGNSMDRIQEARPIWAAIWEHREEFGFRFGIEAPKESELWGRTEEEIESMKNDFLSRFREAYREMF